MSVRTGGTCSIEGCPNPLFSRAWCSRHYAINRKYGDPLHPVRQYTKQGDTCTKEDCDSPPKTGGLCVKHRHLMDRHGTTENPRKRRFWEKVDKGGPIPEHKPELGPCWVWTGYISPLNGYGQFGGHESGRSRLVHRIAYEYLIGPVPTGMHLDHLCRNRACVNALTHLEPVPPRENILRGDQGAFWGYVPEAVPEKPKALRPEICSEPECSRAAANPSKRGMCRPCYRVWLKSAERPIPPTAEERFWAKVDKDGSVPAHRPDLGACWLWTASINPGTGYGQFGLRHGKMVQVHRYAYELEYGAIPDGLDVHHECHRRRCCRHSHLRTATRSENMAERKNRR